MARHSWNRKGPWDGSKDVRRCTRCGMQAYKFGMYSGWITRAWWRAKPIPPGTPDRYSERIPPCPVP